MISASSMHEAGSSKLALWDNPGGWGAEGGVWEGGSGGVQNGVVHVYLWLIAIDVWQGPPQYCEVIVLQLK